MLKNKINYKRLWICFFIISIFFLLFSLIHDANKFFVKPSVDNFSGWFFFGRLLLLSVFIGFLFNLRSYLEINNLKNKLSLWSKLSYYVNQAGEEVFNQLPIGIIVIDHLEKRIQWFNPYVQKIFKNPTIDIPLKTFHSELVLLTEAHHQQAIISLGTEKFECFYKPDFHVFYLFNVTEQEKIKELYNQNTPALALLCFDNLEESLIHYDLSEQTNIQGQYLTVLSDFVENYDGYLKKLFDNRFLLLLKREKLETMMQNKFQILDQVRNISNKYQLKITLSMGVACWHLSYDRLASYAQNAIELAQKRGGDQVVVNLENQNIQFFGAKTDSFIKPSKVNVRVNAQILVDVLNKYQSCFLMGHNNLDFDSLGSMLAFHRIAVTLNPAKQAYVIIDKKKLDSGLIPLYEKLLHKDSVWSRFIISTADAAQLLQAEDLMVVLDTQSQEITHSPQLLDVNTNVVVIDHHRTPNDNIANIFAYVNSAASSTVELLMELMRFVGTEIMFTPWEASILYAGVLIDTNNFIYRTSSITFEVVAKLKDWGADSLEVKSWLRNDFAKILEMNKLINQMEIFMDRFAIIQSTKVYANRSFLAQVSEHVLDIQNIDAAFTVAKLNPQLVGISARSYNHVNVQILMEKLGGGGHLNSAAAQIATDDVAAITTQLKNLLKWEYKTGINMKIILLTTIKNKGAQYETLEVAPGYGNFLIKNQQALLATPENIAKIKDLQARVAQQQQHHHIVMQKLKTEIDQKKIVVPVKVGPQGKIYGKITPKLLAEIFFQTYHILIDRKKIFLDSELNSLGLYQVAVKLTSDIQAFFVVNVVERQ